MTTKELISYAESFNRQELEKYNYDVGPLYDISINEGKRLSSILNVDIDIVMIALSLMDAKLPEAVRTNRAKEHTEMGLAAAKIILDQVSDMSEDKKMNILKCIEEHHGKSNYYSKESEVVANVDCYKFLSPKGIITYISILGRRLNDFEKEWDQLEMKMDEKFSHLSLDIAKEELTDCYFNFKEYLKCCRKQ